MRIRHLPWILSALTILVFSGYTMMYPSGSPAAKTGSPGDGANCSECHGGTATTTAGQITSNIPASGYVPGQTYQITATNPLTGSGKMGFEVSPQNVAGTQLGTLVAGTGSKLVGGTKYVTQSSSNSSTNTWTFGWIAPVAGTGAVTFYGAFARNYTGPTTLSTLTVQEAAAVPAAAGPITGPASVCKNNSEIYSVGPIAGATSYVWTAPAGSTIVSGQGTVSVSVSFSASAVSGNISVYGSNGAGNGAASDLMITVNTIPPVPATPDGPAMVDLQNTTTSDYTTSSDADTYMWQISPASAGTISGTTAAAQVTWNPVFTGTAEITVKGQNSCGESAWSPVKSTQVLNTTGISEDAAGIKVISGLPSGYLTFIMNTSANLASVMVLDLTGKIMFKTTIPGQGTQTINKHLNPGVYIIVVEAGNTRVNKKTLVI
jgi:hypothetical protein